MRWSKIFTSPQAKVIDFLSDHPSYDYSVSEISQRAKVSRPTLYKLLPKMVGQGLLRKREKRYGLNLQNIMIKDILKVELELGMKEASKNDISN
jgi:DNA-binding MarR family transcriptional regulator